MARNDKAKGERKPIGTIVRKTRWAEAQRVQCFVQWCEETEERFIDCLAASCNVHQACKEAGVAPATVYRQRRQRADFAVKWQAALEQGYARLELGLVQQANAALTGEPAPEGSPVAPMSVETALKVLQLHKASVTGRGRQSGWKEGPRKLEEVQESILMRIARVQRARAAEGSNPA